MPKRRKTGLGKVCAENRQITAASSHAYGLNKEQYRMMWEIRKRKDTESGDEVTDLVWEVELKRIVERTSALNNDC